MITGLLNIKNKKCLFKLKDFILEIEEIENRDNVSIDDLSFIFDKQLREIVPHSLKGKDFESGKDILFNLRSLDQTGPKTHTAKIISYVILESEETSFDGIQINADEFNWFHNVGNSYSFKMNTITGESEVKLEPFEKTEKEFYFDFEDQVVKGTFNIARTFSRISTLPIRVKTDMSLNFQETNEVSKAEQFVLITKKLLNFISYRKNTTINKITLKKKDIVSGYYKKIGMLFINDINCRYTDTEKIVQEQLITLPLLEDKLGKLFEKIIQNSIYLSHIPEDSREWHTITPSRFIMITAGFEWQFRSTYNEQNTENEEKYNEQEKDILNFLDKKIEQYTGKNKKYFKSIKKLILRSNMTLSDKIYWTLNQFKDVLEIFIKSTYNLNNIQDVNYSDISERIQTQRNNIAHGNIDKELNPVVILDLIVLEWLYYAMVLNDIGVSRENIKHSINKLFKRGFAL
ncbi:hypothetical protein [Peribacillus frigoritolerans]|uniref:hypothetical protein n=1 Tax=Peribacillus frigoritolerans TaxID=450367 RepID=UPI003806E63A